jgi:hypothetical protein
VIQYVALTAAVAGTAAVLYCVAPAGRGLHRLSWSRARLRADVTRLDAENDALAGTLTRCLIGRQQALRERDAAWLLLKQAEVLVANLDEQLGEQQLVQAENFQLRSDLANALAVGQLSRGPRPAELAAALPDDVHEFVKETATAWPVRA